MDGHCVPLDTTGLIAYCNKTEDTHLAAMELIDNLVKTGINPAVISPFTAMEVLILPRS